MPSNSLLIEQAKSYCLQRKERLTLPRLEVLKIIAQNSKPIGAYEILAKLGEIIASPKPPTAYRAIDFWQQHEFIHRIESLNAYVVCHADHHHKGSQFMICDACGIVIETHTCRLPSPFKDKVEQNGFTPTSWNLEIHGLCALCQSE